VSRILDRGAVTAAFVGIGVAVTIGISFLLIIPIDAIYWYLAIPAGALIGYYANSRAGRRRGEWRWIVPNALFASAVTGLTLAALFLGIKALFFFGDSGFPDFNRRDPSGAVVPPTCEAGADCVYRRYLAADPDELARAGITDAASFSEAYWAQQSSTSSSMVLLAIVAGLAGGLLFGVGGPRRGVPSAEAVAATPAG
jgi:hypothetical protein